MNGCKKGELSLLWAAAVFFIFNLATIHFASAYEDGPWGGPDRGDGHGPSRWGGDSSDRRDSYGNGDGYGGSRYRDRGDGSSRGDYGDRGGLDRGDGSRGDYNDRGGSDRESDRYRGGGGDGPGRDYGDRRGSDREFNRNRDDNGDSPFRYEGSRRDYWGNRDDRRDQSGAGDSRYQSDEGSGGKSRYWRHRRSRRHRYYRQPNVVENGDSGSRDEYWGGRHFEDSDGLPQDPRSWQDRMWEEERRRSQEPKEKKGQRRPPRSKVQQSPTPQQPEPPNHAPPRGPNQKTAEGIDLIPFNPADLQNPSDWKNPTHGYEAVIVVNRKNKPPQGQTLRIYYQGQLKKILPVSTGRPPDFETPLGYYSPTWLDRDHRSKEYDAPMPWSIFFSEGKAFHAATPNELHLIGKRPASHGCVRMIPEHAQKLYEGVEKVGRGMVPVFTLDGKATGEMKEGYKTLVIIEERDREGDPDSADPLRRNSRL